MGRMDSTSLTTGCRTGRVRYYLSLKPHQTTRRAYRPHLRHVERSETSPDEVHPPQAVLSHVSSRSSACSNQFQARSF